MVGHVDWYVSRFSLTMRGFSELVDDVEMAEAWEKVDETESFCLVWPNCLPLDVVGGFGAVVVSIVTVIPADEGFSSTGGLYGLSSMMKMSEGNFDYRLRRMKVSDFVVWICDGRDCDQLGLRIEQRTTGRGHHISASGVPPSLST